jgi:hypothetical protein
MILSATNIKINELISDFKAKKMNVEALKRDFLEQNNWFVLQGRHQKIKHPTQLKVYRTMDVINLNIRWYVAGIIDIQHVLDSIDVLSVFLDLNYSKPLVISCMIDTQEKIENNEFYEFWERWLTLETTLLNLYTFANKILNNK